MEKIYPIVSKPDTLKVNQVEVSVKYSIGDCFGPRGYYVSVTPRELCHHDDIGLDTVRISSDTAGFRCKIMEVARKSAKAQTQADEACMAHINELLDRIENRYGIVVDRNA